MMNEQLQKLTDKLINTHSLEECESKLAEMIEEVKTEIAQEKERLMPLSAVSNPC